MAFQPSSSSFTKARLVVCLVALAATVCLGAYHVRQAQTTDSFARPPIASRQAGPVLVEGPAGGTPFELPNGARVLVAHIEVRDRAPNKKGSALLCSRVLISHLTIDGHPIAWDPSAKTPSTRPPLVGGNHLGYIDLGRESPPLGLTQLTAYCDENAVLRAKHVTLRTLLPGDVATAIGCAKDGDVVPCRDGQDLLSGRPRAEAQTKVREGLLDFLLIASFLGCPSLVALIVLLSQRTASLARPAKGAVS